MLATFLTIVAYFLPIIMEGVKAQKEKAKGKDHEANIQEFRKALSTTPAPPNQGGEPNSIDAHLADQHDRVQSALRGG